MSKLFKDIIDAKDKKATLRYATEISERSQELGFAWSSISDSFKAIEDEVTELSVELSAPVVEWEKVFEELGDVVFSVSILVAYLRKYVPEAKDLDLDDRTRKTLTKFTDRFAILEQLLKESGKQPSESALQAMPYADLKKLWQAAKRQMATQHSK